MCLEEVVHQQGEIRTEFFRIDRTCRGWAKGFLYKVQECTKSERWQDFDLVRGGQLEFRKSEALAAGRLGRWVAIRWYGPRLLCEGG